MSQIEHGHGDRTFGIFGNFLGVSGNDSVLEVVLASMIYTGHQVKTAPAQTVH